MAMKLLDDLWNTRTMDLLKGDEGRLKSAEYRADRQEEKAAGNRARAEEIRNDVEDVEQDTAPQVVGRVVNARSGAVQVNLAESDFGKKVKRAMRRMKEGHLSQAETLEAQAAAMRELREYVADNRDKLKKTHQFLDEKFGKNNKQWGMFGDAAISTLNAGVSIINLSDAVQSPFFKFIEVAATNAIAADWVEDENWERGLRVIAILANIGAYYDPEVGFWSVAQTDDGGLVPTAATATTGGVYGASSSPLLTALQS